MDPQGGLEKDGIPTLARLRLLFFELGQEPPPIVALVNAGAPEEARASFLFPARNCRPCTDGGEARRLVRRSFRLVTRAPLFSKRPAQVRALFTSSGAAAVLTKPLTLESAQSLLQLPPSAQRQARASSSTTSVVSAPASRMATPLAGFGGFDGVVMRAPSVTSASSVASGDSVRRMCSAGVRPRSALPVPLARRGAGLCANCQRAPAVPPLSLQGGGGFSPAPQLSPILAEGRPPPNSRDCSFISIPPTLVSGAEFAPLLPTLPSGDPRSETRASAVLAGTHAHGFFGSAPAEALNEGREGEVGC